MKREYVAFSGIVADNYDQYLGPIFFEPYAIDLVKNINAPGVNSILEIACGTGRVTKHLRNIFPSPVKLIASDLNGDMLAVARSFVNDDSVEFVEADAQSLPFAENSFDVVVCQFGFMFMPDKSKAFGEAFRVLKKNGQFVFNTWDALEKNPASDLADKAIMEFFEKDSSFFSVPFSMHNDRELKKLLQDAGFNNIDIHHTTILAETDSALTIAKALITGTPAFNEIKKLNAASPEKIVELTAKKIENMYGSGNIKTETSALICIAKK
jgi:ubiquinone/menaquinone biosynthesis C-methylase UbiE